jgi:hypothetical protein
MADKQNLDEEVEVGELEAEEAKVVDEADSVPEKYRGKALKDVIEMHQEAEKKASRQAQEVGEVRKLADELIKAQLYVKPEKEKTEEVDFFENPKEAIRRAVDSHPAVLGAQQQAQLSRMELAKQHMDRLHPDRADVVNSSEFQDYVKASPVRIKLFQAADNYDVDAANELLSTFKELKAARNRNMSETEKSARDKTLQSAAVDSGGSGESSKKVYKRSALIQLRLSDPKAFAARKDEIERAYAEGRVR